MNTAVSLLYEPHRGRKCWLVRWWGEPNPDTGRQRRPSKSFQYRHQAIVFKAEKESTINSGKPRESVDVTLTELIEDFKATRFPGLSFAGSTSYENTFKQALEYFGLSRQVRTMGRRDAEMFISSRKRVDDRDGELAPWTMRRHIQHMRSLFAAALSWKYSDENPYRIGRNERSSPLSISTSSKGWHHLTPEEFQRFMAVVESPQRRAMFVLMYMCGLRFGEAANIRISDIDLRGHRVHVANRTSTDEIPPFTIKAEGQCDSSKERSIPIPAVAIPDLTAAMNCALKVGGFLALTTQRFETVKKHWLCCQEGKPWSKHAWRPWQPGRDLLNNTLRDSKVFLERAGLSLTAPFTLNTLRKSYAQNLANMNIPVKTLSKLLGHSNTRVTLEYYNMSNDENDLAAKRAMDRLFRDRAVVDVG